MNRRLILALVTLAVVALLLALFWQAILAALLTVTVGRGAVRRALGSPARRRRPRASWARNLQAAGVAYGAWQARRLRPAPTRQLAPALLPAGTLGRTVKPGARRVAS